jgi:metal-sulfur cluster biosynthetic enzyme
MLLHDQIQSSATLPASPDRRRAEASAALDTVMDPELDEAVTEMGFVERLDVFEAIVEVDFRLPTFWCSANFAFLMASDMKQAIVALGWPDAVQVRLVDHFAAGKINRAVADGTSFEGAFGRGADPGLALLRKTFRDKAFLGRQERLLRVLARQQGVDATLAMTMADLAALCRGGASDLRPLAQRYYSARQGTEGGSEDDAPAFVTLGGEILRADKYSDHLRAIRRIRGAAEANAEMCRIYLDARYAGVEPGAGPALYKRKTR